MGRKFAELVRHSHKPAQFCHIPRWVQLNNGRDLFQVGLHAPLINHMSQELDLPLAELALLCIQGDSNFLDTFQLSGLSCVLSDLLQISAHP